MNKYLKNILYIFTSFILIGGLFAVGYAVGESQNSNFFPPANVLNTVDSSTNVDFSPFWKVWNLLETKYVKTASSTLISNQDKLYGAISGLVDSLNDPYTVFLTPSETEQFNTSIQGNFEGVGMEIGIQDEILTVIAPLKNTPAERAGIKAGDKILKIDEKITESMSIDAAVKLIRGPIGTEVKLTIFREGQDETIEIVIKRDKIVIPTIDTEIKDDIFIISLYNFSANSSADFRKALREFVLSRKNKLILDLRDNPGGFLESAVEISSWFLPTGKTVVIEDFGNGQNNKVLRSEGYDIFNDNLKMVILINGGSASASEIVAGALHEHGIATLIGEQTFGKGSVQELIDITPETALKVTIAKWLTPNGKSISDGGLTPDIIIDSAPNGKDLSEYQLEEAIKYLNK